MPLLGDWGRVRQTMARVGTLEAALAARGVLAEQAQKVAERAKDKLGTYQEGWAPLAESTQAGRARAGYPADTPLLRTGQMRSDITSAPEDATDLVYAVGIPAAAPSAAYAAAQELGSASGGIPPRPYLGPALAEQEAEIVAALRDAVGAELLGP